MFDDNLPSESDFEILPNWIVNKNSCLRLSRNRLEKRREYLQNSRLVISIVFYALIVFLFNKPVSFILTYEALRLYILTKWHHSRL